MNRIKESVIIALGVVVMGLCVKSGIDNYADKNRCVTVKGLSEREVEADKVIWPVMTKEIGNDLPDLYKRNNATVAKVKAFLLHSGIKEGEIMVNSPVVVDLNADQYISRKAPYRYNLTSVITVTSTDVKLVRSIINKQAELLQQGVAIVDGGYGNRVAYEYTAFQKIKPKMMEEAIKNAQTTAQQFAKNSGSKLGKIQSAGQGQFTIDDRDDNTPYIKKLRVVSTVTYSLKD